MRKNNSAPERDKIGVLVLILALLGTVLLFFWRGDRSRHNSDTVDNSSISQKQQLPPGLGGSINRHMKDSFYQSEFVREKIRQENALVEPIEPSAAESYSNVNPVRLDQENAAGRIVKEIDREKRRLAPQALSPEDRINEKLARDEWVRDYDEKYTEEFVKQFIENARQEGVDIRVNDDLDVTGLSTFNVEKPIRIPQSVPKSSK